MKDYEKFWISKKDWMELGPERAMLKVAENIWMEFINHHQKQIDSIKQFH